MVPDHPVVRLMEKKRNKAIGGRNPPGLIEMRLLIRIKSLCGETDVTAPHRSSG